MVRFFYDAANVTCELDFLVAMVLRDRLTVVDVWFGFQVDGKLILES